MMRRIGLMQARLRCGSRLLLSSDFLIIEACVKESGAGSVAFLRRVLRILVFTEIPAKQVSKNGGIGRSPEGCVGEFPRGRGITDATIVRHTDF
jgi:hypothetical protein